MKKEERYEQLHNELKLYFKMLCDARRTILDQDVSDYPIFVFHQQHVELGIPLADRHEVKGNWSVNASTLEEFVARQLVKDSHLEDLREKFVDPEDSYCLFVLSEMGAQFIFVPVAEVES